MQKSAGKAAVTGLVLLGVAVAVQLLAGNAEAASQGGVALHALLVGVPALLFLVLEIVAIVRASRNRHVKRMKALAAANAAMRRAASGGKTCPHIKNGDCTCGGRNSGKCSWNPQNYAACAVYRANRGDLSALYPNLRR